jgi:hypothetical protein
MHFNFAAWLHMNEESTQLMGTQGTGPGQPTPSGAADNKKVNYRGNKGCRGGPGDCPVVKPDGCSGYACPPPVTTGPIVGSGGGGGAGGGASPAMAQMAATSAGAGK